jgi:hypothetical protein
MGLFSRKKAEEVMGHRIRSPHLTGGAVWLAVKYIGLPVTLGLALLDVVFYLYFQHVLDRCYGVLCFLN